ncbi:MAG TPA: hypothetical protein VML55_07015 [Planctomycetaceae bacterium]|nr:hypothetical protein [Planctomycetaceae bacterium]
MDVHRFIPDVKGAVRVICGVLAGVVLAKSDSLGLPHWSVFIVVPLLVIGPVLCFDIRWKRLKVESISRSREGGTERGHGRALAISSVGFVLCVAAILVGMYVSPVRPARAVWMVFGVACIAYTFYAILVRSDRSELKELSKREFCEFCLIAVVLCWCVALLAQVIQR